MKSLNVFIFGLAIACIPFTCMAQADSSTTESNTATTDILPLPAYHKRSAIAINASSIGIGLEYAYNLNPALNIRVKANYLALTRNGTFSFDDQPILITGTADMANVDLALEYLPFRKSSFKLVGGLSYFIDANATFNIAYDDDLQYGDITINREDVGEITLGLDYPGLAPYAGFGFGRAVPKKRVGFGIEIGTYYAGSPYVSLEASKMLSPTEEQELEQLEDNLSGYSWLPFVNVRLAIRI